MSTLSLTYPLFFLSLLYAPNGHELATATTTATVASAATWADTDNPASSFIRTSCQATRYPLVCIQSLSTYVATIQKSPKQLVTTALSVSLDRAQSTKAFVGSLSKFPGLKPREYAAIKDCLQEVGDSVDRLGDSVRELKRLGQAHGPEFEWHMSNLQTWVSAALTDDSTCLDGLAGRALDGKIKTSIKAQMTDVAQVTSNALALCNHFAGKY